MGNNRSDSLVISPDISDLGDISYTVENDTLLISWTNSLFTTSKLIVERVSETENQPSIYTEINPFNSLKIPVPENLNDTGLAHNFTFIPVYENEFGTSTGYPSELKNVYATCPINFEAPLINENRIDLSWDCFTGPFNNLKLYANNTLPTTLTNQDRNYSFIKELEYHNNYTFSFNIEISGKSHTLFSKTVKIDEPEPVIEEIKIIADELVLNIYQSNNKAATYEVLQGYRGYNFEVIGSVPPDQNTFRTILPDIPGCINSECRRDIWFEYKLASRISPESESKPLLRGLEIVQKQAPFILNNYEFEKNNFGILPDHDAFFGFNNTNNETIIVDTESSSIIIKIINDTYYPFLRLIDDKVLLSDLKYNTVVKKLSDGEKISTLSHNKIGELYDAFFWQSSVVILLGSNGLFKWSISDNSLVKIADSYSKSDPSLISFNTNAVSNTEGVLVYADGTSIRVFANTDGNFTPYFEFKNSLNSPIIDILSIKESRSFYFLHSNGAVTVNDYYRFSGSNFNYLPPSGELSVLNKLNNSQLFFFNNSTKTASFISTLINAPAYRKPHQTLTVDTDHFYNFVAPDLPSTIFGITRENTSSNFQVEFYKFDFQKWKTSGFEIVNW